jgi:hypothetical protein
VSLRWKSELAATLGRGRCHVEVQPGLFGLRSSAQGAGTGDAPAAIAAALQALLAQAEAGLPKHANLTVPDECVYYALLPATSPWSKRHEIAAQHFAESLGRQDLRVRISLVDAGRSWLAAAIDEADRLAWAQPFVDAGVALRSIRPALIADLERLAPDIPSDGVTVMVRDEGVMLLVIAADELVELRWERCDESDFEQRVEAFARAASKGGPPLPVAVFTDDLEFSGAVARIAAGHQWKQLGAATGSRSLEVAP